MDRQGHMSCTICNRTFIERSHLRSHFARVHRSIHHPISAEPLPAIFTLADAPIVEEVPVDISDGVSVSYELCNFYTNFQDMVVPMFSPEPKLTVPLFCLRHPVRHCVSYACQSAFSTGDSLRYYNHVLHRDRCFNVDDKSSLSGTFPTHDSFLSYCRSVRKTHVVQEGWKKTAIHLRRCQMNKTGCFRCPLKLMTELLRKHGGGFSIIPFEKATNESGSRTYSSPWDTAVYESYAKSIADGHIVLIDFYADGTTLSKSGTQSASFFRVRFSNIRPVSDCWFTIAIAPTTSTIPSSLPYETKRRMRLELYQRFIFRVFCDMITASYSGFPYLGDMFFPRLAMIVADQPEERALLCLKRRDSFMDCTHCTLPSRIPSTSAVRIRSTNPHTPYFQSSSDDESPAAHRARKTVPNITAQLSTDSHPHRDVARTLQHQLCVASHNRYCSLPVASVSASRRFLVASSAHDLPPALGCFAGLGSPPHLLYNIVSFDKLHVIDLGITRQFCDLVNTVIQKHSNLPLSRLMAVLNDRYMSLPAQARLSTHRPFRSTQDDSQAGLSAKIRRQSAPFIWCVLMGVSSLSPDDDELLQCAFLLSTVNNFLCNPIELTEEDIDKWQSYLFDFGSQFASVFKVDISTKLHRVMRHFKNHLINLGCLRRGSSEENEMRHKDFKAIVENTNHHLDSLSTQLLNIWVGQTSVHFASDTDDDDCPTDVAVDENSNDEEESGGEVVFSKAVSDSIALVDGLSGQSSPEDVVNKVLQLKQNGSSVWVKHKSVQFSPTVPRYNDLLHKTVLGGTSVYGRHNRHDAIFATVNGVETLALVDTVFGLRRRCDGTSTDRLVLLRLLAKVDTVDGNHKVEAHFGHKRFKHHLSEHSYIMLALVPATNLLRPAMVVVDPYWFRRTHGLTRTADEVPDTQETQSTIAFFLLKDFNFYHRRQRNAVMHA